jgi:transcription antitermination factor NusA-like protein
MYIAINVHTPMSKHALHKEIKNELCKLNDRIDRKIIKGQSFRTEARRHKELLITLSRLGVDQKEDKELRVVHRSARRAKSPVRRSLAGGVVTRLFGFAIAR